MRTRHEEGLKKSVMLLSALQTMSVVREMHDKSCNFPDRDTFAFDTEQHRLIAAQVADIAEQLCRFFGAGIKCKNVWVWKVGTCDANFGL